MPPTSKARSAPWAARSEPTLVCSGCQKSLPTFIEVTVCGGTCVCSAACPAMYWPNRFQPISKARKPADDDAHDDHALGGAGFAFTARTSCAFLVFLRSGSGPRPRAAVDSAVNGFMQGLRLSELRCDPAGGKAFACRRQSHRPGRHTAPPYRPGASLAHRSRRAAPAGTDVSHRAPAGRPPSRLRIACGSVRGCSTSPRCAAACEARPSASSSSARRLSATFWNAVSTVVR